jgi:MATE family multidrug resistance protein
MVLAAVAYWLIGIPAGYLIGFRAGVGAEGIWMGLIVGLIAAFAGLALRFRRSLALPELQSA